MLLAQEAELAQLRAAQDCPQPPNCFFVLLSAHIPERTMIPKANTSDGHWEGFDVGSSREFAREVERTGQNKKLMKSLAARRNVSKSGTVARGIPLAEVTKQLGLD